MSWRATWRPGWTIAQAIWRANQRSWSALLAAAVVCGLGLRVLAPAWSSSDAMDALAYVPLGLSLFLTFVLCNFTEADPRGRGNGFPARLFTLPVSTRTLVVAPMVFGVGAVWGMYSIWAKLALPALGRELPLGWPGLYLATGMICYQATVWSLARFRTARLLVLGVAGTFFAIGWVAFREGFERGLISWLLPESWPVRPVLCGLLGMLGLSGLGLAYLSVASERRGGRREGLRWRRWVECMADVLPGRRQAFDSARRAQFWFEWRRHGMLLPLSVTGILALIMAPAPFCEPVSASTTAITLAWILLLPLLLAFALGMGFGKADLWSKTSGLSLFLATRPLPHTAWIGAKMRAAGLATVVCWMVVLVLTPLWICYWCDWDALGRLWRAAEALYPAGVRYALPALLVGTLMLTTWHLLIGNLFVGFSGKSWLLTIAACAVFVVLLGTPFLILGWTHHPDSFRRLLRLPPWLPWLLAGLFTIKVATALFLTDYAHRRGWVNRRSVGCYLLMWLGTTGFLMLSLWLLVPVAGWIRWTAALLALFAVPLLRVAYAPIALARNRCQ